MVDHKEWIKSRIDVTPGQSKFLGGTQFVPFDNAEVTVILALMGQAIMRTTDHGLIDVLADMGNKIIKNCFDVDPNMDHMHDIVTKAKANCSK